MVVCDVIASSYSSISQLLLESMGDTMMDNIWHQDNDFW